MEKVEHFIYLQFILNEKKCLQSKKSITCIFEKSIWMHLYMWFFNILIVKF
jgi:hypothetical protein